MIGVRIALWYQKLCKKIKDRKWYKKCYIRACLRTAITCGERCPGGGIKTVRDLIYEKDRPCESCPYRKKEG